MSDWVSGNILLVSNYPSDTAYAWWLMECFWQVLAERAAGSGAKAYLAYPKVTMVSERVGAMPVELVELCFDGSDQNRKYVRKFLSEKKIKTIYFSDKSYCDPSYLGYRCSGVERILLHDHTPGDRPSATGLKGVLKSIRNAIPAMTADAVFCVSDLMRERNIKNGRIPASKCLLVQNGIEPIRDELALRNQTRARLNLSADTVVVITTGRAHSYKRFDFVINCANVVRSLADRPVVFLLVGDGPAYGDLKRQVSDLGLERVVRMMGYRADVKELLCAADIALHASLGEGFSLSIVEYMSATLPVLVPDIPSVSQAIKDHVNGCIYPSANVDSVAHLICQLANDDLLRSAMGKAAKEVADKQYSLDGCIAQFKSALDVVM